MSKRPILRIKALLALMGTGAMLFNVGNCTTDNVRTQLSSGLNSAILGILGLGTQPLADDLFDVDD